MDRCSTELITLIVEFACANDFGHTARRIGLVSKYFRAIAEPIEFQVISVSGLEKLEGVCGRLDSLEGSGVKSIKVRHLFISELTKEHALAVDRNFSNGSRGFRSSFWWTKDGKEAKEIYFAHAERFWALASDLVKKSSSTLRTLFLLAHENWLVSKDRKICPKILGILSGTAFPSLISLGVHHNARIDSTRLVDEGTKFLAPATPSLRSLLIISPIFGKINNSTEGCIHPLFEGALQSPNIELTDLLVCCDGLSEAEHIMRAVFGEDWRVRRRGRKLPGKLRSIILQQGVMPDFGCGTGHMRYLGRSRDFVEAVKKLHIDGLEVQPPQIPFPGEGQRRYELLFADWKERCLESF